MRRILRLIWEYIHVWLGFNLPIIKDNMKDNIKAKLKRNLVEIGKTNSIWRTICCIWRKKMNKRLILSALQSHSKASAPHPPIKLDHIRPFFSTRTSCQHDWINFSKISEEVYNSVTWTIIRSINIHNRLRPKLSVMKEKC